MSTTDPIRADREPTVTPPRLPLALAVGLVGVALGPGLAAVAVGADRATPAQAWTAAGVTFASGLVAPAVWLAMSRVRLSVFMVLTLGLSMTRTVSAVVVAAALAWLNRSGGESFWMLILFGAAGLFVAEKAAAVVAAWPALGLSAGRGGVREERTA
jgi:hypothetical protein